MPLSAQRLARNQVIFREVNKRLREMADAVPDGTAEYLCECGDVHCTERIELRLFQYESVRARANAFFIVPGHERLEVERVIDENHVFAVIEKVVPLEEALTTTSASGEQEWTGLGV